MPPVLLVLLGCPSEVDGVERTGTAECAAVQAWYRDEDGDGYGQEADVRFTCGPEPGRVTLSGDCDDQRPDVYPGAPEECGATVDLDCDGWVLSVDGVHAVAGEVGARWESQGSTGLGMAVAVTTGVDGAPVAWLGAPRHHEGGSVFRAPLAGWEGQVVGTSLPDRWTSSDEEDALGAGLSPAGDIDGDGVEDVVAGVPSTNRVFLLSGAQTGEVAAVATPLVPPEDAYRFGADVEVGDTDGDGTLDLVVGAAWTPAVFVYPSWDGGAGDAPHRITRTYSNGELGEAVAPPTDLDGDGFDDLLIGDQYASLDADRFGAVFVLPGPLDGPRELPADASLVLSDASHGGLGLSVAILGDADADGVADWLAGSYTGATGSGGGVLVRGGETGELSVAQAWFRVDGTDEDELGQSVLGGVDLDGDGRADPIFGDPEGGGRVLGFPCWAPGVYLASDAAISFRGDRTGDSFGWALAAESAAGGAARRVVVGSPGVDNSSGAVLVVDLDTFGPAGR